MEKGRRFSAHGGWGRFPFVHDALIPKYSSAHRLDMGGLLPRSFLVPGCVTVIRRPDVRAGTPCVCCELDDTGPFKISFSRNPTSPTCPALWPTFLFQKFLWVTTRPSEKSSLHPSTWLERFDNAVSYQFEWNQIISPWRGKRKLSTFNWAEERRRWKGFRGSQPCRHLQWEGTESRGDRT